MGKQMPCLCKTGRNVLSWVLERGEVFLWSADCFVKPTGIGLVPFHTAQILAGPLPPTTPHSWCYTSACWISTPALPFLGANARRVRLSLMPSCPFPGAGHAAWAAQGHRALPCRKQPALATVPGTAPQIFHSIPRARVIYTLWETARPALSSLLGPLGGALKPTITFLL